MKQTGFLFKLKKTDYITGASPLTSIDVHESGDWRAFLPEGEKQYKYATFDTMSCSTFSALNIVETWLNWFIANDKLSASQLETINKLGFYKNGKFNASDRFTAIMSGTTHQGNYFQNVWDSIRHDGLLPEVDFPFGGNSWEEYHDPKNITEEMTEKAKKILDILNFSYEWVAMTPDNSELILPALKQSPLHIAIPVPGTHAVEQVAVGYYFDSYEPYVKEIDTPINYIMKVIGTVKPSRYVFTRSMKIGDRGEDVEQLQIKFGIKPTGFFYKMTQSAVRVFQRKNGLQVDGIVGPKTLKALNK